MTDSFGISENNFEDSALVASRWTSGGNSDAARRARVALQRRDKYGRWAEMGGGVSFPGRMADGSIKTVIGRYVGPAKRDGYMRVEVTDPKAGVPKGVYEVNGRVATVSKAILSGEQLEEAGVKLDVNGNRIGENLDKDIEPFNSMYTDKTPDAAEAHLVNKGLSDDEKKVEEKARLEADPHVSYNVVDENGNPVVEAPAAPKASKPKLQKATAAWLNSDSRKNGEQIFFTRRGSDEVIEGHIVDGYVYEGQIYNEDGEPRGLASVEELIDSQKNGSERGTVQAIYKGTAPLVTENGRTRKALRADILKMESEQRIANAPKAKAELPPQLPQGISENRSENMTLYVGRDGTFHPIQVVSIGGGKGWQVTKNENGQKTEVISTYPDRERAEVAARAIVFDEAPRAQAQLPPEGPDGPSGPRPAVAVQKLAKDVDAGDQLIDTTAIESDEEKRHVAGVVERIVYDDEYGTATFLINKGNNPDGSPNKVTITRRLMTPMGVDPQTSPNGGNNLSVEGNAAYERYMARRNPPQAQTPPSTPTPTPTPSEPSKAQIPPTPSPAGLPDGMSKNPSDNMTLFNRANGDIHPIQVLAKPDGSGWDVTRTNPRNGDVEVLSTHSRRGDAESEAIARISQEELSPTSEPTPEPSEQELVFQGRRGDGSGAFIDRTKLTPEQLEVLNNLLSYRQAAKNNLGTPPAAGTAQEKQAYELKLALLDSLENAINNLEENTNLGVPEKSFVFGKSEDARTENLRIIPSSLKTEIARDPKLPRNTKVITEAKGIFISKTGAPYLVQYRDGTGTTAYRIIDGKPESNYCGSVGVYSMVEGGSGGANREDYKPRDASIGMIKVHDGRQYDLVNGPSLQGQGIADYMIMMTRFVAQNHGRRFAHSNTLYAPGNIYGKRVSLNLEDQDRYQRDKALFFQAPDSPIIAALKATGRLGYRDTHWATQAEMKRRKLEGSANQSALWPIGRKINAIADDFRRQFKDNPNAQPGVDYPAIFERHVKSENGDWTDHDLQMQLLRTAYKEGMSKDQILAKLDEYIELGEDGKPWPRVFNDADTLIQLRNNIANNPNWDAYERKPEPLGLVTDEVKFWDSPFTSGEKFTNFIVPKGMTPVRVGPTYVHRPNGLAPEGSPADWTENPSELATRFSSDELVSSLRTAVLAKTNDVTLKFGGNQEGKVNSGSVYRALREQGQDAQKILAGIYDEALGDGRTDNQDALSAYIAKQVDETEAFNQFLAQYGVERPVAFSQVNGIYNGFPNFILQADMVRRIAADENSPSIVKVRPLAATNEPRTLLDGTRINSSPYRPNKSPEDWLLNGVTDDPKILAYNFSTEALGAALSDAIINNKTEVVVQFSNNKTLQLPIHAIRDTLQHQGVNTESILDNHSNYLKPEPEVLSRANFGGAGGVLDAEGNRIYELVINGNANKQVIGKFKNGETNLSVDGSSYTLVKNINGVETSLAKIEKNAEGKYDVWYRTEFDQPPTMTFDSARVAIANIADAFVADGVFSDRIQHIESMTENLGDGNPTRARFVLQNKKVIGVSIENPPADRPDLLTRQTFTIAGDEQVLAQNATSVTLETSSDETSINLFNKNNNLIGSITKSGNFFVVKDASGKTHGTYGTRLLALERLNLIGSEKLELKDRSLMSASTIGELRGRLIFNKDMALGDLAIRDGIQIPAQGPDGGLTRKAVGEFFGHKDRLFDIVGYTNNKKQGAYRANSNFEFLNLKLYNKEDNPDAGREPVIKASVVRVGRSEWRASIVFEDDRSQSKYIYRNDPLSAVDKLKEMLDAAGITNDSVKFDDIVPKRTVSATANDQGNYQPPAPPAPAPAPAPAPVAQPRPGAPVAPAGVRDAAAARAPYALQPQDVVANPIDVDRVNRVLDRINNNIPDLTNTTAQAQRLGGGATAPEFLTLPNGLKIKVKTYATDSQWRRTPNDLSERLNVNDVAVSALADLVGVNATPGGFALINGKKIIADPIEPNVDSRFGWQDLMANRSLREDPANAQAVQDYKNIVVFNTLVGGGDWLHHHANFLVVKNPDGTRRLAICDGGKALIGGVREDYPDNEYFEARLRGQGMFRSVMDRYHTDFMAPGAEPEVMKSNAFKGIITRDEFIQIAREKVLPLTPEVIAKFAEIYQNPDDRRKFIDNLTRRRAELLTYLGIDDVQDRQAPLNAPSVPAAPQAPAAPSAPTARSVRTRAPRVPETDRTNFPQGGQPLTPIEALRVQNPIIAVDGAVSRGVTYTLGLERPGNINENGKLVIVKDALGNDMYASIKTRADGSVVAVLNPLDFGKDRNGNAELAIFRGDNAQADAENYLSGKLHTGIQPIIQNYFAANDSNKDDLPIAGQVTQQPQIIKKGFLNPTTDRQRMFARRLVEGKKMSDADRAKYRGVLNMSGLTVGEVGGIIDAIKDNEDRSASDIARSVEQDHAVPANEVVDTPSDLANTPSRPSGLTKRAIDLIAGDRIITGGRVAFVHDRGNGKVDIGVVTRDGKLSIVRNIDADLPVDLLPEVANNQQMVGGNNAVNNFAGNANKTVEDIKNAYPGHEVLPNGDLVVGKREFTDAQGVRHRYEAVVHRTADETFVGYVRQLRLAPNGNIVSTRAAAFTAPAHSSVAALNRISTLFTGDGGPGSGMNGTQPNNWFNNLQSVAEGVDPRTGQLLPTYLLPDPNIRRIGNTGIESTGDGLKDALIAHVANLIDRGVLSDQVLEQVAGANNENFAVLSRHQFMDIIERIEARRANPGVNAIPYVSMDEKTIVRVGDTVHHYDARGNRVTLPGGAEKVGKVVGRQTLQVYEKAQGRYEYRDILMVKFEGRRQITPIAARRLAVITRADGSPPLPAVNEPNAPQAPQAPQAPAGLPTAIPRPGARRIPNFNMIGIGNRENVAIQLRGVLSPELDVVPSEDPNDPRVRVYQQGVGRLENGAFVGTIRQLEDGKYKAYYNDGNMNVTEQDFANLEDAIDFMRDGIGQRFPVQANNAPAAPQAPSAPSAPNPNNPDNLPVRVLGGRNVIERENADETVEFINIDDGEILAKVRMTTVDSPGGGVDIWLSETRDGLEITGGVNKFRVLETTAAILDGIGRPAWEVPRVIAGQDGKDYNVEYRLNSTIYQPNRGDRNDISVIVRNGKWDAVRGGRDGRPLETIQSFDFRKDAERHAEKLIMEGNQAPAAPAAPSSLDREVPSNVVNLPAGARVNTPEEAQDVQTLLDNEIPRNRYEVTRNPDGTKFVVVSNNNLGAEAFVRVEKTANGWRALDRRQIAQNLKTIYEGNDRRVAEMHAMNRITGADGGQNPAPEAPAPVAPLGERNIEIEGRPFRGRVSDNGNRVTFYDDSGNEAATITRQADGRTFTVSEPFGGNIGVTSSFDDAVLIAGRKIQDNIALGLMDESNNGPSSGPGTNLPPTPAPSTPESSAPSDIINGADGVAYSRDRGFDITTYSSPSGTNNPLRVTTPNNGTTWTVDNNGQTVTIFGTREEAEAFAENLISGQPANLPATPAPSSPLEPEVPEEPRRLDLGQVARLRDIAQRDLGLLEQQYPDGRGEPDVIDIDPLDGVRKALPRSEFLRRKINQYNRRLADANQPADQQTGNVIPSQAPTSFPSPTQDSESDSFDSVLRPDLPYVPAPSGNAVLKPGGPNATPTSDANEVAGLSLNLRGVKINGKREADGTISTFDDSGKPGAIVGVSDDGTTWTIFDPNTRQIETASSEEQALGIANAINFTNVRNGYHQPAPEQPATPALPNGYSSSPIGSGNSSYEVKHDTDTANTPYYLAEQTAAGNWIVNKWNSQDSAVQQRFRRPAEEQAFTSKEEADQWIANDLGSSDGGDGGNGGGGNPPSEPPTTPPAGGNFATDRIPAGMSLQEKDRLNIIGPSGLQLGFNDVPDFQGNRPKVYGYYSKVSEANGKYKAVIQGLPDGRAVLEFSSPEEAHNWVVENLSNFASPAPASPTPAPAPPTPVPPFNPVIPQGVIGKQAVREWIQENYGDLDEVNKAIFGNYEEITPHLVDALNMKRAFDGGFTELGSLPRWGDPGFRQGGSLPDAGVNANRKIQLSDGTFAYLKHMGGFRDEAFNEVMAAKLFEAVGVNDLVAVSVVDPRPPSESGMSSIGGTVWSVLTREIPGEMGEEFNDRFLSQGSDAHLDAIKNLKNARELSLIDYLINNDDRHENNWIHRDDVAYPIDHGYAFNVNTNTFPLPTRYQDIAVKGNFRKPIEDWVRSADPKVNPLFTKEELTSIYSKINTLRDDFAAHSVEKRQYFDNYIMPRFNVLMGIWR